MWAEEKTSGHAEQASVNKEMAHRQLLPSLRQELPMCQHLSPDTYLPRRTSRM